MEISYNDDKTIITLDEDEVKTLMDDLFTAAAALDNTDSRSLWDSAERIRVFAEKL